MTGSGAGLAPRRCQHGYTFGPCPQLQDGSLPVYCAAANGHLELVKYLLDLQPETISVNGYNGNLPVHGAAFEGHLELVKYLLDLQPDTISAKNDDGALPVRHAASKGHVEVVKYLLELQPDTLSVKDKNGSLPVHSAAENGHLEVVKYLLNLQPDTISAKNDYGNLPVHRAAFKGHLELVKYLLDLQPDTISAKNNVGRTPLGQAVCAGEAGCVPYLLDVTWAMLPYDEANEIVEEVRRIAEKKESMPILDLIKTSLTCAEFGIVRYNYPTELIANVCGAEGSGKSTFIASFTAKGFFNKLLRKEHQPDMKATDLASRTKGIEETMWKQLQVNVRFRDFAGHDHYSASHDLFAVAMTAPSVATIVVDGTESVEEITKRVSATAASYACRQSTSDDGSELDRQQQQPLPIQLQSQSHTQQAGGHQQKLDVVAIATRADLLTPFQRNRVERAVVEGMKSCSQRLELAFVRVVDARNSSSSSMNELRRAFLHLVHKLLAVRAMDTVAATESSSSETCQAAVPGSTAEAAAATATPKVSVAHTVSSTVAATADTVAHEAAATTTLADNVAHTVAATAEVTAVATGTVADTMMQTATAMDTVTTIESSTSETCQAVVIGSAGM
ncbi:uncharacterized protein LOC135826676 [Sycon ciliatum]|uniref:uncharacterized protein LOC135826676 n=1 Tax=Sycon ciliatum TaxID=27933 RepID=UPI0031F683C2